MIYHEHLVTSVVDYPHSGMVHFPFSCAFYRFDIQHTIVVDPSSLLRCFLSRHAYMARRISSPHVQNTVIPLIVVVYQFPDLQLRQRYYLLPDCFFLFFSKCDLLCLFDHCDQCLHLRNGNIIMDI